jgi:hypothetical protein
MFAKTLPTVFIFSLANSLLSGKRYEYVITQLESKCKLSIAYFKYLLSPSTSYKSTIASTIL